MPHVMQRKQRGETWHRTGRRCRVRPWAATVSFALVTCVSGQVQFAWLFGAASGSRLSPSPPEKWQRARTTTPGLSSHIRPLSGRTSSSTQCFAAIAAAADVAKGGLHLPKVVLLALFILVDTGQALVMDWAEKRSWQTDRLGRQYARQTVLVFESLLSILTGVSITVFLGGVPAMLRCFELTLMLKFLPVAVCFAVGLSLKMMAVNHFQAGTIKIVGQLRLPLLAVASTLILARTYSIVKWQVIAMITTSCMCFVLLKGQGRSRQGKTWQWNGLAQLLAWVSLNVCGGVLAEMTYKSGNTPFYIQKVAQDVGHLCTGLVMLFLVVPRFNPDEDITNRETRPGGFFDSWDLRTVAVTGFLFLDAWIGNLLLKEFSGVTRSVAKACGVATVYFVSLLYSKEATLSQVSMRSHRSA